MMRHATKPIALAILLALGACSSAPDPQDPGTEASLAVAFTGNASFPDFRLRRVVEDLLIDFQRDPQREAPVLDASFDLQDFYLNEGFPDASVTHRVEREPALKVVFAVTEGPRVTVARTTLTGNEAIATDELLALWKRTNSGLLGTGDPYFVDGQLRAFAVAMRQLYWARGHLDVAIEGPQIERAAGASTANVAYTIRDGAAYRLETLDIAPALLELGAPNAGRELVGAVFSETALRTVRLVVREALENRGYPDPRVQLDVTIDREHKTVQAAISGEPGERAKVVGYRIAGLDRTARSVVESQLRFDVGEWYSGSTVEQAVQRLYTTGVFEKVEITPRTTAPGEVELDVALRELEGREVSFLAGYGSYEQARGGVFYTDRNLFGHGHYLRVGAKASVRSLGADATWTEPTLFDSDTALTVTTFAKEREEPAFTDRSLGFSTALSRRLLENTQARIGYGLESRDGSDIDPSLLTPEGEQFLLGTMFTELSHDNRDSRMFPTRGHRETVKLEYADTAFGGDVEFTRLTGRVSLYVPLAERWTIAAGGATGLIWPLDGERVPVQERFFNGGDMSVRSFEEARLGPRLPSGTPIGGEYYNVMSTELRFPLISALSGALFADAGNVGERVSTWGLSNLRYAVGGGIRLDLPIGPIRFDAGFNPDPTADERDYTLHLSVGYPF